MARARNTQTGDLAASDIPVGGWVDRWVPKPARPFVRLARYDRPIGTWLLLFPCWWSLALAIPGWPDIMDMALFGLGALAMRGAGCTYNDICDRDFDAKVARTQNRPLPAGDVSMRAAVLFLIVQMLVGVAILLSFNRFAIAIGAASLVIVFTYPLMKRVTYWPQLFLGLAFNWGALLGWAATTGALAPLAFILYGAGILWTLGYDTIYAHQDREDDAYAGVKSTARRFGLGSKPWLYAFYLGALAALAACGAAVGLGWIFYAGLLLAAAQAIWQVACVDLNDAKDCLAKFKSNRLFGWIVLAAIVAAQASG